MKGLFYFVPMSSEYKSSSTGAIKNWSEDDRPREKMMHKGRSSLANAELIAVLLGSGSNDQSAVQLAQDVLANSDNNLNKLAKLSLKELMKFKGIGIAKAISISAAIELGRRRMSMSKGEETSIKSSKDAFNMFYEHLADLDHECFYVLLLNRANRPVQTVQISQGGVAGTVADTRLIFKTAIDHLASAIILGHNHPSGNKKPSQSDINLTKSMVEAGRLLEIAVLDHIIVAGNEFFSFADEGMI